MSTHHTHGLTFSIPYNGDLELIRWALQHDDLQEVYFQPPTELDCSDPYDRHEDSPGDFSEPAIVAVAELCHSHGIRTNLLCNQSVTFFAELGPLARFLERRRHLVDAVTISDPYLVSWFRERYPEIELQASVYMEIDSSSKARVALEMGISTICAPPSTNRRRSTLEAMMALARDYEQFALKLLACPACFDSCVYYRWHSQLPILARVLESPVGRAPSCYGEELETIKCLYPISDPASHIQRPFIRPDDISYYEEHRLAHQIKIAFRNERSNVLKRKIAAYLARSYTGDLFEIIDASRDEHIRCDNSEIPEDFAETVLECDKDHARCGYCARVAEACLSRAPPVHSPQDES